MRRTSRFVLACATLACWLAATRALAVPVVYSIDDTLSFLKIEITGVTVPQNPGSDTTFLNGSLSADLTATTLELLGGGTIGFELQPIDPAPGPFGAPGTAPGQYGLQVNLPPFATGPVAVRDAIAEALSPAMALTAGTFDATQIAMSILSANLDYDISGTLLNEADRAVITNQGAQNTAPAGTLTTVGLIETLFIPVNVPIPFDDLGLPLTISVTGEIVATRIIPEPGTLALFAIGAVALIAAARRRGTR